MKNPPTIHDRYSRWWYEMGGPLDLKWMGVPVVKCPFDLHMYQEFVWETKPDIIVETGSFLGGSAFYLAHLLDIIGHGQILSLDIATDRDLPEHPRIEWVTGVSSTAKQAVDYVAKAVDGKRCMVILDSKHTTDHVLDELNLYSGFVSKGCYLIVEDTNVHGYRLAPDELGDDNGPAEAVKAWQPRNRGFEVDNRPERLGMSQNPGGYLRRVR